MGALFVRALGPLLFADYLFLAFHRDVASSIPALTGVTALAVILLAVALYVAEREELRISPATILIFALAARLLFVFLSPGLSDDLYRYLWDGLQTLHGNNPYALSPAASIPFDPSSAAILKKVNHPQYCTIYPPGAQAIFAGGAALGGSVVGFKLLLVGLDMATCSVIMALLASMNLPLWRTILYAWHPLPVIEIAWSGHIDGGAILFLLISLLFVIYPANKKEGTAAMPFRWKGLIRAAAAGAALALSVLTKLIPLIYLPLLFSAAAARFTLAAAGIVTVTLLSLLFLPDLAHMLTSLDIYLRNWEFSNAAFRSLRTLLGSGDLARSICAFLLTLTIAAATVSFVRKRHGRAIPSASDLAASLYVVSLAFCLFTPTLHPWYALYLVAFLPFAAGPAGLVLSWTVFLSYHVIIRYAILGEWTESSLVAAVIWLSPIIATLAAFLGKRLRPKAGSSP